MPTTKNETYMELDGTIIDYVVVTPDQIRIFRKGGGKIDVAYYNKGNRQPLAIEMNNKQVSTQNTDE